MKRTFEQQPAVLVADPSPYLRAQVRAWCGREPGLRLCGEADSCAGAVDLFFLGRPDLVLLDVCLPPDGGFEVLRTIRRVDSRCNIILLQNTLDPFVGEIGRQIGANEVCHKHGKLDSVREAIRRLIRPAALHAAGR